VAMGSRGGEERPLRDLGIRAGGGGDQQGPGMEWSGKEKYSIQFGPWLLSYFLLFMTSQSTFNYTTDSFIGVQQVPLMASIDFF
jgi:hypothetical protein